MDGDGVLLLSLFLLLIIVRFGGDGDEDEDNERGERGGGEGRALIRAIMHIWRQKMYQIADTLNRQNDGIAVP